MDSTRIINNVQRAGKTQANQQRLILAHRGATQKETLENTLKSVGQAIKQKADIIELDVRMTWDSQFIIFHDFFLDRLTGWSGLVNTKTLRTLRQIKLRNGDSILTIDEVLEFISKAKKENTKARPIRIALDLKDLNTGLFDYEKLIKKIKKYNLQKSVIFIIMNYYLLKRIIKTHPEFCYCYFSWLPTLKVLNRAKKMNAEYVGAMVLTKDFIRKAHKKNLKVIAYSTDSRKKLLWRLKNDVDVISTSNPGMLRKMICDYARQEKEMFRDKANILMRMWKRFTA